MGIQNAKNIRKKDPKAKLGIGLGLSLVVRASARAGVTTLNKVCSLEETTVKNTKY